MSGRSRTVACIANVPLADFLCGKREDFQEEAKAKLLKTVDNACNNICGHPTAITNLHEAKQVKSVGPWILKMLKPFFDGKENSIPEARTSLPEPTGRKKAKRKYVPAANSGPYALLLTLAKAHKAGREYLLKKELIELAEESGLSNNPIRANAVTWNGGQPKAKDWYSGWSSMTTLIKHCLAVKYSNPGKYKLTDEGKLCAEECLKKAESNLNTSSGHGLGREEDMTNGPVGRESGESSPERQEDPSSDEDIQEIRKSDMRQRNNAHFSNPQTGVEIDDRIRPALVGRMESSARATNLDVPRNASHYSVSPTMVQGNGYVPKAMEMFPMIRWDELAVPPLEAGAKFSDVYEIIFVLDNREKFRQQPGPVSSQLLSFARGLEAQFKLAVEASQQEHYTLSPVQIRQLPVGDAMWIARHKQQKDEEYALDFVAERKQVDDFWTSIKSPRYKQQKLRLMNCGLKRLMYLVEGDVNRVESTDALKTAMFSTELLNGFCMLRTEHTTATCKQYGHLTLAIIRRFNKEVGQIGRSGRVCKTYSDFVEHCKSFGKERVTDIFCRQLTQISHVTENLALSIQDEYPTLLSIVEAYRKLEGDTLSQERLLVGIKIRDTAKTITAVTSKKIYAVLWGPPEPVGGHS